MNEKNKKIILIVALSVIVISAFIYYLYERNKALKEQAPEQIISDEEYAEIVSRTIHGMIRNIDGTNVVVELQGGQCTQAGCEEDNNKKNYKITSNTKIIEEVIYVATGNFETKENLEIQDIQVNKNVELYLEAKDSENIEVLRILNFTD